MEDQTYDPVGTDMSRQAGYFPTVYISRKLSDRLEVPEEWQDFQSFDSRLVEVLAAGKRAMAQAPAGQNPTPFTVMVPSHFNQQPEVLSLQIGFDGDVMIIDFTEAA